LSRYHAKQALSFEFHGKHYNMPAGSDVEIREDLEYAIESRGLLLHKGSAGKKAPLIKGGPMPVVKSTAPPMSKDEMVTKAVLADELADATGEDPQEPDEDGEPKAAQDAPDEGDTDESSDDEAAAKTMADLEAQGIQIPGARPGRKARGGRGQG
jgi:hypothetical protein